MITSLVLMVTLFLIQVRILWVFFSTCVHHWLMFNRLPTNTPNVTRTFLTCSFAFTLSQACSTDVTKVQDPALSLVKTHVTDLSLLILSTPIPMYSLSTLKVIKTFSRLGVIMLICNSCAAGQTLCAII